jgi:hypothetical protein
LSTVDQAAAAVAVVAFIASEHEAGREADDSEVLFEMLRDTVPEALAHLAATIVCRVPGASDELARIGHTLATLACQEGEAP